MPRRKYAQAICALALITSVALSPLPAHASTIDDVYGALSQALSLAQQVVLAIAQKAGIPVAQQNTTADLSTPSTASPDSLQVNAADPQANGSSVLTLSSNVPADVRALVSGQADASSRATGRSISAAISDLQNSGSFTSPTISAPTVTGGLAADSGAFSGNLSVAGNLTVTGAQSLSGAIGAASFTANDASATSTFTRLTVTRSDVGTVVGGTWQGSAVGIAYGGTGTTTATGITDAAQFLQ